jgi:hypothetical protein
MQAEGGKQNVSMSVCWRRKMCVHVQALADHAAVHLEGMKGQGGTQQQRHIQCQNVCRSGGERCVCIDKALADDAAVHLERRKHKEANSSRGTYRVRMCVCWG